MTISMTISSTFLIFPQSTWGFTSWPSPRPVSPLFFAKNSMKLHRSSSDLMRFTSQYGNATSGNRETRRSGPLLGSIPTIGWAILTNKNGSKWGFYMFLHETGKLGLDTFEATLRCSVTASCGGFATNVSSDFTGLLSAILKPSTNTAA